MGHEDSKYEKILKHYSPDSESEMKPKKSFSQLQPNSSNPKRLAFHTRTSKACEGIKDDCCHHLLLDIYLHALPMDDGCAEGNVDKYNGDIDEMLDRKGCSASQYFRSAAAATGAPLLEFVNRSIDLIGQRFMEKAEEAAEEAEKDGIDLPDSEADETEIENQLVEVKSDTEYEDFVGKLKQKTIKKIVADISSLITDKRDEKDMTFSPKTESAFCQTMDYISTTMLKAGCEPDFGNDDLMELAVRESTLFALDEVFAVPDRDLSHFGQHLKLGKGIIVTESAVTDMCRQLGTIGPIDDRSGYDTLILENQRLFDESLTIFQTEGVIASVGKGIKWLVNKIIELCRNLKNMIVNTFKPKLASQTADIKQREAVISAAFSSAGISIKQSASVVKKPNVKATSTSDKSKSPARSKPELNQAKPSKGTSGATIDTKGASELGRSAANAIDFYDGDGRVVTVNDDTVIIFNYQFELLNGEEYTRRLHHYLEPLFDKANIGDAGLIQQAKTIYGANGTKIPVIRGFQFNIHTAMDMALTTITAIENFLSKPSVTAVTDVANVDSFYQIILNGLFYGINTINMNLVRITSSIQASLSNPFTDEQIKMINTRKDLGKIVEYIIGSSTFKNTFKSYLLTRPLIERTAKQKGWITTSDQAKSGTSRIVINDPSDKKYVYKYAWNKKGIIDNKKDLDIKRVAGKSRTAEYLALPTDDSSKTGIYLVVPKADPISSNANTAQMVADFSKQASQEKIPLVPGDVNKSDNFGMLNGKLVFIDYGNFTAS